MHLVAIGGSDAGISAALRARELDPGAEVTVVVADAYPNFSICGIPYYISGEVTHWRNLAHRSYADLEATGMRLRLDTLATSIDVDGQRLAVRDQERRRIVARPTTSWSSAPAPSRSGHPSTGSTNSVSRTGCTCCTRWATRSPSPPASTGIQPTTALIVGAGYVGLEMAEGLTARGIAVTQVEMLPEVLPTVDPELGALVHAELERHGVDVHTSTTVTRITAHRRRDRRGCTSMGSARTISRSAGTSTWCWSSSVSDPTPTCSCAPARGPAPAEPLSSTRRWRPVCRTCGPPGTASSPTTACSASPTCRSGTTAHKQGRVAGENALGGRARFAGSLGTQVVKVFDLVAARTGLREHEARAAGYTPLTSQASPDDHKAYYPGAHPITIRITGDAGTGALLGAQLIGALGTETAKRVDTFATALFHDMTVDGMSELDLSYTPPLGSPWDAVQMAAQTWVREHQLPTHQAALPSAGVPS